MWTLLSFEPRKKFLLLLLIRTKYFYQLPLMFTCRIPRQLNWIKFLKFTASLIILLNRCSSRFYVNSAAVKTQNRFSIFFTVFVVKTSSRRRERENHLKSRFPSPAICKLSSTFCVLLSFFQPCKVKKFREDYSSTPPGKVAPYRAIKLLRISSENYTLRCLTCFRTGKASNTLSHRVLREQFSSIWLAGFWESRLEWKFQAFEITFGSAFWHR